MLFYFCFFIQANGQEFLTESYLQKYIGKPFEVLLEDSVFLNEHKYYFATETSPTFLSDIVYCFVDSDYALVVTCYPYKKFNAYRFNSEYRLDFDVYKKELVRRIRVFRGINVVLDLPKNTGN